MNNRTPSTDKQNNLGFNCIYKMAVLLNLKTMKNYLYLLIICAIFLISENSHAQDASPSFDEAKLAYNSGSLDDARFALEQALQHIDQAIGKEILGILPANLSGMKYLEEQDNVVGTNMGFAGLFVDRNYSEGEQSANVQVIGDSPMMAMLNTMLALPAIVTSGNEDQKRIKVDGYKSLLQKETNADGIDSYTVQIPGNSTLITFNCQGFTENETISMVNLIPVTEIVKLSN